MKVIESDKQTKNCRGVGLRETRDLFAENDCRNFSMGESCLTSKLMISKS